MSGAQQSLLGSGIPRIIVNLSSNTTDYNLFSAVGSPVYPVEVLVTVAGGVYVYATSGANAGFDVGSGWAPGSRIKLTNQGNILGKGGKGGGRIGNTDTLFNPQAGGTALKLSAAPVFILIDNFGAIAGGGGGGGAAINIAGGGVDFAGAGGGGAGGGDGGDISLSFLGGLGGGPGLAGADGTVGVGQAGSGGGRAIPGTGGAGATNAAAGTGGSAGGGAGAGFASGTGTSGNGGAADAAGGNASAITGNALLGGGGGGWGASGGNPLASGFTGNGGPLTVNGAAGGKAVDLNGANPTWVNTGTRYGAIA